MSTLDMLSQIILVFSLCQVSNVIVRTFNSTYLFNSHPFITVTKFCSLLIIMKKIVIGYFLIFYHYSFVQSNKHFAPSNVIFSLMNELNIKNPTIFDDNSIVNQHQKMKFVKGISKLGNSVSYNKHKTHPNIIFTHLDGLQQKLNFCNQTTTSLVVTKILREEDLHHVSKCLTIDKRIYFLDGLSWKLYETYTINKYTITNFLGHVVLENVEFVYSEQSIPGFEKRRSNFFGLQLNGMIDSQNPYVTFPENFTSKVKYFSNNNTYDMTNVADGIFINILHSLEKSLNFSTKLYLRKDRKWGMPLSFPNGSYVLDGMIKSLVEVDSIDIIWTSLDIVPERIPYVDFLPAIAYDHGAIFIQDHEKMYQIQFSLFLEPLTIKLWIAILLADLLIVGFTCIMYRSLNYNSMV